MKQLKVDVELFNCMFLVQGWNKEVVTRLGVDLIEGITEYFSGEYTRWRGQRSFTKLGPTLNIVKTYFVATCTGRWSCWPPS